VCLCPRGEPGGAWRHIVLWDAPPEAFRALPEGPLFEARQGTAGSWMAALPDVDTLRRMYVAARRFASSPVVRMTLSDIELDVARSGGFDEGPAIQMGLAVLNHMELIEIDPEEARLTVPPGQKRRPEDDALFQRLLKIADYAAKGVI
ncbi:MAG: hypothetical protein IJ048_02430, partial [Clostridia bacterium]|nr:hypothetical protein [Clostridia bacterium]